MNFQMFKLDLGTRDQIVNIRWIMEKARSFQKNIYFCFVDYEGSSIYSKRFLPTVADIMVI